MSENRPVIIALIVVGLAIVGFVIYSMLATEPEQKVVSQPLAIPVPEPAEAETGGQAESDS